MQSEIAQETCGESGHGNPHVGPEDRIGMVDGTQRRGFLRSRIRKPEYAAADMVAATL
jgi:hypothetical protein